MNTIKRDMRENGMQEKDVQDRGEVAQSDSTG